MIERIAILGTGLLGTSVGLALRAAGFRGSITGWNRSPEGAQTALSMGAIDSIATDPLQMARESQVVLLAVPIYATLDYMEKLSGVLGSEHLVTDVGSTKGADHRSRGPPLQHAGARGVFAGASHGRQGARRRGAGRCQPFSRSGLALYRRSHLGTFSGFIEARKRLAGVGCRHGLQDPRSRPRAPR